MKYNKLLEANKQLERELEFYRTKNPGKSDIARGILFKAFNSASYLMAISKLDTGQYVDINNTFLKSLGYRKEEIIGHTPDDIHIFTDIEQSNKYIKLISRLKKIKDYPVILKTKIGEEKPYLFSAETIQLDDEVFLLTIYYEVSTSKDRMIKDSQGSVLNEIFVTVSSYLTLYSVGEDNRFYIVDLNSKVEKVESLRKSEVIGKCIDDTPLVNRVKLVELLHYVRITGNAHKLAASPEGDDSEGYYMGFLLTSGNIFVTWEPGKNQKQLDDLHKQGIVFEKFAEMLPEMIYEVDLKGKVVYFNQQSLNFFGYSKDDLTRGINISDIFPDNYKTIIGSLKVPDASSQTSDKEYLARKKDGTIVPIVTHSFAIYLDDKIIGHRGVIRR